MAAVQEEMLSFLRKFNQISGNGYNATLCFNSYHGRIFANIHADIGQASHLSVQDYASPSVYDQTMLSNKNSRIKHSRMRRRRRREKLRCSKQNADAESMKATEDRNLITNVNLANVHAFIDATPILTPELISDNAPEEDLLTADLHASSSSTQFNAPLNANLSLGQEFQKNNCMNEKPVLNYVPTQLETMMHALVEDLDYGMCRKPR